MRHGEVDPRLNKGPAANREVEMEREREVRAEEREARAAQDLEQERRPAGATSWQDIKSRFVDDPKGALAAADELVRATVEDRMRRLKEGYEELRRPGDGGDESSTESLRNRLIRYHAYFESLSGRATH